MANRNYTATTVRCPQCKATFPLTAEEAEVFSGKKARCPHCSRVVTVPILMTKIVEAVEPPMPTIHEEEEAIQAPPTRSTWVSAVHRPRTARLRKAMVAAASIAVLAGLIGWYWRDRIGAAVLPLIDPQAALAVTVESHCKDAVRQFLKNNLNKAEWEEVEWKFVPDCAVRFSQEAIEIQHQQVFNARNKVENYRARLATDLTQWSVDNALNELQEEELWLSRHEQTLKSLLEIDAIQRPHLCYLKFRSQGIFGQTQIGEQIFVVSGGVTRKGTYDDIHRFEAWMKTRKEN